MQEQIQREFGEAVTACEQVGRELRLHVLPNALVRLAGFCKDRGFQYPADITAVDTGTELRVVYRLLALDSGQQVVISVQVPRAGGRLPTLCEVFQGAEWPEREVYDLFGVSFDGHPNLRRILLTDDWEGHPLLK
jgi:NADH-quinone oxidoreductase subunit C